MMKANDSYQWSVAEAKSKLSEVIRRAREMGPQFIGTRNPCVVISQHQWDTISNGSGNFANWLIKNTPKIDIPLPKRGESKRPVPLSE